jgi:hypothetical protein
MADLTFTKIEDAPAASSGAPVTFTKIDAAGQPAPEKVYYNEAGQPFTMSGKPPAEDKGYTGTILPLRRDDAGLHPAVPEAIASPVRGMAEGGMRAFGIGEAGQNPLRPLDTETLGAVGTFAGAPTMGASIGRGIVGPAERATATTARSQATVENRAADVVSKQFAKGAQGGAPTAADVVSEFTRARTEGQPLTLSDINNPALGQLAGTTYRQGGAARSQMKGFYETRGAAAGDRVAEMIDRHLSDEPLRGTAAKLVNDRSVRAKPLWDEARAGGSLPPITDMFANAFGEAKARFATNTEKVSRFRQAYDASTDTTDKLRIGKQLQEAVQEHGASQITFDNLGQRLMEAQADGSANAPGAVWSPRLQELLDQPEVQQGLRRGWAIERRNAVGKGQPFNPTEYAVTGVDEAGQPIVGKVPNMALLMVAKEGLDAVIDSSAMKDSLTGRPTKAGLSYINLREGLVQELDRLNPKYAEARNVWSGDTASIRALNDGRGFLEPKRFSPDELAEYVGKLTDSDKQFFVVGVADALKNKLFRSADSANKGRVINTEDARMRLRPLFGSDEEAQTFIDAMERERSMGVTPGRVYGGSPTAERVSDDRSAEMAVHAAHGLLKVLEGRWLSAIASGIRVRRMFGGKPDEALSQAVAKALTDPDAPISDIGPLLPQKPLPSRLRETPKPSAASTASHLAPAVLGAQDPGSSAMGLQ